MHLLKNFNTYGTTIVKNIFQYFVCFKIYLLIFLKPIKVQSWQRTRRTKTVRFKLSSSVINEDYLRFSLVFGLNDKWLILLCMFYKF